MRIDIDYKVVSGEWKGKLVTGQVAEAIGRAVGRIGVYTDSRDAELINHIDSISFRCHGSGYRVDVVAIVVIVMPATNASLCYYRSITQTAAYRLSLPTPVEDFGEEILDAVAKEVKFKRPTKYAK